MAWWQRGLHDIEHQITYPGSNFIFHDSQGFESGSTEELDVAQRFIERRSAETELKNQLHAIWYLALCHYITGSWGFLGTACPWTVLDPFCPQNLNSLTRGQAMVSFDEYSLPLISPFHWELTSTFKCVKSTTVYWLEHGPLQFPWWLY